MNKMKQKTKSTIVTTAVAFVMLAGGLTLGANADNIVEFAADKLGYEKVIEEEKTDETGGETTDEGTEGETDGGAAEDETTGGEE